MPLNPRVTIQPVPGLRIRGETWHQMRAARSDTGTIKRAQGNSTAAPAGGTR